MSCLCNHGVPKIFTILILLFVIAVTTDNVALQATFLNATHIPQLSLNDNETEESEHDTQNAPIDLSTCESELQSLHLFIRYYIKHFKGYHIPSSPSIFFQPDRAPPVLFQ
jgi:hypothetical protein